jgi:hypothetical protein
VAAPVRLPALTNWKHAEESPEAAPGFDDTGWQVADKTTTNSVSGINKLPVLYADDYGFHTGNTWYRGRFHATGKETGVHLVSDSGGGAQAFSAWLNGTFLGSSTTGNADFTFPAGSVKSQGDNVISVLTVNMGHEEDYNSTNGNKTARGLTSASLVGAPLTSVTWRLQGVRGGEDLQDPVRGPLSTGGLYGERAGWSLPGRTTVRVPKGATSASRLTASLSAPDGWSASATSPLSLRRLEPGRSATFTWKVQPAAGDLPSASALITAVHYAQNGRQATGTDERIVGGIPAAPPAGESAVSDLPFLSSTNGWGPVERDSSVGEQAAGNGRTITVAGVGYAKGLGTNALSDIQLYLGGKCSRLTAEVGVDDETGGAGTVTFSVIADGKTLVTTPTMQGRQAAVPIDVDVSGAQVVDLKVGDAGDGNGNDHGDWAVPTLTCG